VVDGVDLIGLGLPRRTRGVECRLQVGQFGGGSGTLVCSFGETCGELVALVFEMGPVAGQPVGDDRMWFPDGLDTADLVGEVAALGDSGEVGPVVASAASARSAAITSTEPVDITGDDPPGATKAQAR
jgi:hypothetical protein